MVLILSFTNKSFNVIYLNFNLLSVCAITLKKLTWINKTITPAKRTKPSMTAAVENQQDLEN